jgi:8-oxo-dGTP diphosphatase
MKVRPSILVIENQEVLLLRYRYGNVDVYNLPGGNPEPGETLTETLVRELQEELGIKIEVRTMILSGEVILPEQKEDVLHCVFRANVAFGTPVLNPAETSALEVVWIDISEINTVEMYPNVGYELQRVIMQESNYQYVGKIPQQWH